MSGIGGFVPPRGAPVDAAALERMAACLAFRGPDGLVTRALDGCGLVHALLLTGDEAAPPAQPFSLDGSVWITADARIDARDELARALRSAGEDAAPDASAAELILRAYRSWGDACLSRLLGDFAFAIWDGHRRRLFCARDPFGVKLLYHARPGGAFVFSNTLECVLRHPGVGAELDEAAVADFLVHSIQVELDRTMRRDVRALPPGHLLSVEDGRVEIRRWWELPVEEPLRYRRVRDYTDHFVEVMAAAVRDRVPQGPVSVLLSGGRDSPTVAAFAREAVGKGERVSAIHAFTAFYERLIPDRERHFASLAAEALDIPVTWLAADDYRPFERFDDDPRLRRPEPVDSTLLALEVDQWTQAAEHARVALTGFGGDAAQRETRSRLTRLALGGHLFRAGFEAAQYAWYHRRVPHPGVRTWLRRRDGPELAPAEIPPWLEPGFAARIGIAERVAEHNARRPRAHPTRPEAYESLLGQLWPYLFSYLDPGVTGIPLEHRHPFFDLRLVRFLLCVPPAQWYNDKGLIRIGMRGRLPEPIIRRPKSPLAGDPLDARYALDGEGWLGGRTLGAEVEPWVDPRRVARAAGGRRDEPAETPLWQELRPMALSVWLRGGQRTL